MTGVLAYIALKAVQLAGSSGRKLFFIFYVLSSAFTICTSNDIVILTLTPIIFYCTKVAGISPFPMLFAEFFTANICSMVLVIGNPVNLIVANANGLSFNEYAHWMAAPAIVGTTVCCFTMYLIYRKDIDVTFTPPVLDPDACLKDKRGVVVHGTILFLTRILLGVSSYFNGQSWQITLAGAGASMIYNCLYWPWDIEREKEPAIPEAGIELIEVVQTKDENGLKSPKSENNPSMESDNMLQPKVDPIYIWETQASNVKQMSELPSISMNMTSTEIRSVEPLDKEKVEKHPQNELQGVSTEPPTIKASIINCPWAVMPFVYGMFTLVAGLKNAGWIDAFAQVLLNVIPGDEGNSAHAITIATLLMATISFVMCSIIDNQPASIFLTQVLLSPIFQTLPDGVRRAGMLGVLEGANVGGCWSLMGALAGIMWATLLRNKGIIVGYIQFMKVSLRAMPLATFVIALIIIAESV